VKTINIIVPSFHPQKFSGGFWCVMQYAVGLAQRGHRVRVIPLLPSSRPQWIHGSYQMVTLSQLSILKNFFQSLKPLIQISGSLKDKKKILRTAIQHAIGWALLLISRWCPQELQRGLSLFYIQKIIPIADVTLATSYETALPVALYGTGKKAYFLQHYEPYFKNEAAHPLWAEQEALRSYMLGLEMIANSLWLKDTIESQIPSLKVKLCLNAINHEHFKGTPKKATADQMEIVIISYGGRDARWKGFMEMATAVKIARNQLSKYNLRWHVYGDALLPPQNDIASYVSLGFLYPEQLAEAYRGSDLLLSASWYESFPLFPLEAMACGLPVITTQPGAESFAIAGETAEIVQPRNPEDIARGLIQVIQDIHYRNSLAEKGWKKSHEFNWIQSIDIMEHHLCNSEPIGI
jgi:glycosyltransferase involved in cell wall biosynthesis